MTRLSNSNKTEGFKDVQNVFTQHMRDPENNPAPEGIEDRRMDIYRELVYNNIEGFIGNSFPVLRKITADKQWHDMLRDYVSHHKSHTPLFPKMPQEFLQYLEQERSEHPEDPPFLLELAHYEWIETALSIDPNEFDFNNIDREGDLLEGIPVLSPLSRTLSYSWPVHEIDPENVPDSLPAEKTYIVVYRNRDDEVGFMVLNPVSARLLDLISSEDNQKNGQALLEQIVSELQHPNPDAVIQGGHQIMQDMLSKSILLGTKS